MDQDAEHELDELGWDAEFVLEAELARRWRRSVRSMQRWRTRGDAPDHHLIGGRILYRRSVVEAVEKGCLRRGRDPLVILGLGRAEPETGR